MRVALLLLCACGRIAFEPAQDGGGAGPDDTVPAVDVFVPSDPTLLLHFSFENGLLVDDSGGNDATCATCPTLTTRPGGGQAVQFNGSTTCLAIPLPLGDRPANDFTAAAWFRIDVFTAVHTLFGAPYDTVVPTQNSFEVYTSIADTTTMQINNSSSAAVATPTTQWHHVALVWSGGSMRAYLDGGSGPTVASGMPLWSAENLTAGCDRDNNTLVDFFNGALDEIRLYARALDAAEIAVLAQ